MSLTEFRQRDDSDPVCPHRGCQGRKMTPEEVILGGHDGYIVQPDESKGEYWACCIIPHNQWIHVPPRED